MVPGVPVTLCQTQGSEKQPRKPVSKRARTTALPGPSLGRGAGSTTRGYASYDDGSAPSSWCEKGRKTQQKGKAKTTERNDQNTLAASRPEKRASEEYQENPKNARGPEWHPKENTKKQDARPKRVNK